MRLSCLPENMEVPAGSSISSVFTCDLQDIFYNYGYLGAYLDIGGGSGDDRSVIFDINDEIDTGCRRL